MPIIRYTRNGGRIAEGMRRVKVDTPKLLVGGVLPINKGGTGASTPLGARTNLGLGTWPNIPFPATQTPSADPNTLDDYEEGTWTPDLSFGGNSVGISYSSRPARYTKIGRLVHVQCHVILNSKGSSTGAARVRDLPFTVSTIDTPGTVLMLTVSGVPVVGLADAGGTNFTLYNMLTGATLTNTDFANTTAFRISCQYTV